MKHLSSEKPLEPLKRLRTKLLIRGSWEVSIATNVEKEEGDILLLPKPLKLPFFYYKNCNRKHVVENEILVVTLHGLFISFRDFHS